MGSVKQFVIGVSAAIMFIVWMVVVAVIYCVSLPFSKSKFKKLAKLRKQREEEVGKIRRLLSDDEVLQWYFENRY